MPYYYHGPVMPGGRKPTGGKIRKSRGKRKREAGRFPALTTLGPRKLKMVRVMGGNYKPRLLADQEVNVALENGQSKRVRILEVVKNPADVVLTRRGIITKGAIVRTELGLVKITSRPGQHGILNGILMREEVAG